VRAQRADVMRQLERLRLEVADLRASRRRLALADDEERRSIERAFHDGVQQQLVALAANLERAGGSSDTEPATTALLEEMRRDVQQALGDARDLAHRIYPPMLDVGGLGPALRTAALHAHVPTEIHIAAGTACPPEIARVVYLCCLAVLEHAGAGTPATITVRTEEGTLAFEVAAGELGAGWLPLRDRVEAFGGRLRVRSDSDQRTRLVGSVPIEG